MNIYTVSVNPAIDLFLDVPEILFDEVLGASWRLSSPPSGLTI
ncbi:MAG: hypothetical protein ACUVR3_06430 [Candidatus Roseilinea sp.]